MDDIIGEHAKVDGAYAQPTLTLLNQKYARVILAIFRTSFSRDTRSIEAPRLHAEVDAYLTALRLAGIENVPAGSGRDLCMRWTKGQWLQRIDEDDEEVYKLTSHAQQALDTVKSLIRDRTNLTEHRISNIVNMTRRFNADVNPDPERRIDILDQEIAELTAERDRLLAGGELQDITDDYLLDGYSELLELISDLPRDFARVEEALLGQRATIVAQFLAEDVTAGTVLDTYLADNDEFMSQTMPGRAFEGAVALLRDDEMLSQLRADLRAVVSHPRATEILNDTERKELVYTSALIAGGIERVLAQRNKVLSALRDYIVTHDVTRDRELDTTLRQLEVELTSWMADTGPRTTVDMPLLPPDRPEVSHLSEKFYDPLRDAAPPPLTDNTTTAPAAISIEDLRHFGGPSLELLRAHLGGALQGTSGLTVAEVFATLDPSMRRPVELLGVLDLAAASEAHIDPSTRDLYEAIRPDGTRRTFAVPSIHPKQQEPTA